MNSVAGPLLSIGPSSCTEGCITRCILYYSEAGEPSACIIVYVLMLNKKLYLIDSYSQILIRDQFPTFLMPKLDSSSIGIGYGKFPNDIPV